MYVVVWTLYSIACLVAMACLWWWLSPLCRPSRRLLLMMPVAAVCFTPVVVAHGPLWMAPAIAAAALELVAGNMAEAMKHLQALLVAVVLASLPLPLVLLLARGKTQKS